MGKATVSTGATSAGVVTTPAGTAASRVNFLASPTVAGATLGSAVATELVASRTATSAFGPRSGAGQATNGLRAVLARGQRSTCIGVIGDSTSDGVTEWFGLFGQMIGNLYPTYTVLHRIWSDTNQNYDLPVTLQTGTSGEGYVTTASGGYGTPVTTPTGDLDIRAKIMPTGGWAPGGATQQTVVANYETASGNARSFAFDLRMDGKLDFVYSTDGTSGTAVTKTSSTAVAFTDGTPGWVRVVHDVDNGASGNDVLFYTSTDGATWIQLGTTQTTAGVVARFTTTNEITLACRGLSGFNTFLSGRLYYVDVRNGIAGYDIAPNLPDMWIRRTGTSTITASNAPTLLLLNGCVSGQSIVGYHSNSTRRTKALYPAGQRLFIINSGHNEVQSTWVADLSGYVTNVKTALPLAPIVILGQNATLAGSSLVADQQSAYYRAQIGADALAWAAMQYGVYGVDIWPTLNDPSTQTVDGLHPTAASSLLWAQRMMTELIG